MILDPLIHNIYVKRFAAFLIDFSIELGGCLLGGYFGAMVAALVVVLREVSPDMTQKAIWTGMIFGFFFWGITVSLVNRVVVQGMSRATIGKKLMHLEIISTGAPISWEMMLKRWLSLTLIGEVKVVSTLVEHSRLAPILSIRLKAAPSAASEESSDKKAA